MDLTLTVAIDTDEHKETLHQRVILPYVREMEFVVWGEKVYCEHPKHEAMLVSNEVSVTFDALAQKIIDLNGTDYDDSIDTMKAFIAAADKVKAYLESKK